MSDPFSREEKIRVLENGLAVRRQYLAEQEQLKNAPHIESDNKSNDDDENPSKEDTLEMIRLLKNELARRAAETEKRNIWAKVKKLFQNI